VISSVIYRMALLSVLHALNYIKDSGAPPSSGLRLEYSWRNNILPI
jgi:hypothetical protein